MIFGVGELLDKIDDGSSKLRVWDLHECLGKLEAIRGSEIVCYILHRCSVVSGTAWKYSTGIRKICAI
jgi:hypothetical protein